MGKLVANSPRSHSVFFCFLPSFLLFISYHVLRYYICFNSCSFFPTVIEEPRIPQTDIVFALSATSAKWRDNFQQMKDAITSILDTYSMDVIRVGVVVFGSDTDAAISIQENKKNTVQTDVKRLFPQFGVPDLDRALKEARRVFKSSGRPDARKVVVVISDRGSDSSYGDVKAEADRLREDDITLISVVIGKDADPKELEEFTPHEVTEATTDGDPKALGEKIIILVLKGK